MEKLLKLSRQWYRPELGLLLIRVVTGMIFINHGWMKFQDILGIVDFFDTLGLPALLVYVVAIVELVGGLMLVFGVVTRAAAVALGIVALFAALLAVIPRKGFSAAEFELLLAAVSFGLALIGSGKHRMMHLFEHDKEGKE